jgi:hypothetical protein
VGSAGAMSCLRPAKAVSAFVPHSATALHALAPPSQSMECGGKRSATPLWLENVPLCQKHPAIPNSHRLIIAIRPPLCGECRGHELPSPSQSGVGVRSSLCHRTPCIGLRMGRAGMECGGKGAARHTALAGNRSLVPKHPAVSNSAIPNSAIRPPLSGECGGHELPSPSQSGVDVRASLCHRTPCIGLSSAG